MELYEERIGRQSCSRFWYSMPERISKRIEHFYYRIGMHIAINPWKWIFACSVIIMICLSGLYYFRQEKNPAKLWAPKDSNFAINTEWLMSHYKEGIRFETFILTGDNVLEQKVLIKLNEMTKQILSAQIDNIVWKNVCMKIPVISSYAHRRTRQSSLLEDSFYDNDLTLVTNKSIFEPAVHADINLYCNILNSLSKTCLVLSILDIWNFDSARIEKDSTEEIIEKINGVKISPTLGHPVNFSEFLGGVTLDEKGRIVAATAIKTDLIVHIDFLKVDLDKIGNIAGTTEWATEDILKWESAFLNVVTDLSNKLDENRNDNISLKLYYHSGRSFGDLSQITMFQDLDKLGVGIILMFFYIIIILSNWNWVELRYWLTSVGLMCVGSAFIIAVGICSLIGIPYGPVHTSLPFLLLGLGVDDIFVFMTSWRQINANEQNLHKPVSEKIGLALGHAGSAITVTSLTDMVAFLIGATTILPTLRSYCIYAAVGIFVTFMLQVTFFIACFTFECRRIEKKRNGILPCIVHEDFQSKSSDPRRILSWKIIDFLYSRLILTIPGKILVVILTIVAMSFGIAGSFQLRQWFNPLWMLPKDSYMIQFVNVSLENFPDQGFEGFILMRDNINYSSVFPKIIDLTEHFSNISIVQSLDPWPINFATFVSMFYNTDLRSTTVADDDFYHYLSRFLVSQAGAKYQRNFLFNETFVCGKNTPRIVAATIELRFKPLLNPTDWVLGMDNSIRMANEAQLGGYTTVWSKLFATWTTDKVISQESRRNLFLALICVMGTTAVLIAEIQTCFWILLCILLTLVNVCGFMHYWGLTIDIASCIGLQMGVGWSVDYAAHIAYAFLNTESRQSDKNDRNHRALEAVRYIGAAVAYGAGSTWLAVSMLSFSTSHIYISFFKIFYLVILFGVWHGLFFLPVVLSTIGPRSLRVISQSQPMSEKTAVTDDDD